MPSLFVLQSCLLCLQLVAPKRAKLADAEAALLDANTKLQEKQASLKVRTPAILTAQHEEA